MQTVLCNFLRLFNGKAIMEISHQRGIALMQPTVLCFGVLKTRQPYLPNYAVQD